MFAAPIPQGARFELVRSGDHKVIPMNKYSAGFPSCKGGFHVNFIRPS